MRALTNGRLRRSWTWLRARWYRRWPLNIAALAFIFWVVGRWQARHLLDDDLLAPDFTLRALDGRVHSLRQYRGKKVVLQFFAPWCFVCRLESDNWARVQSWRSDVQVLGIALSYESRESVVEFIGDDLGAYPVLLGDEKVRAAYRIESFPSHYILDEAGRITSQSAGYSPTLAYLWRLW